MESLTNLGPAQANDGKTPAEVHGDLVTDHETFNAISLVQSHNVLSFNEVDPVDVKVRNLTVIAQTDKSIPVIGPLLNAFSSKKGSKEPTAVSSFHDNTIVESNESQKLILNNISADIRAGSMMAIIGGSGSGKTSFLNVIANRMKETSSLSVEGEITFNGHTNIHKTRNSYVLQQDILQPTLTCRETLNYAADLRFPSSSTPQERKALVEEVILELGLKECANTIVGDNDHKGLSGGEKRRLSLGIQLLANPSVLFLDEPTTGLDANSAYLLVKTCHMLASRGRTLIMSLHQPRSDIFFLFDSVAILSKGCAVYSGPVSNVIPYFESIGHDIPHLVNPADFLIDLAAVDYRTPDLERESLARVKQLVDSWNDTQAFASIEHKPEPAHDLPQLRAPFFREVSVLTRRSFVISYRDPMGLAGLFLECTLMGVICGWIFYQLDGSLAGIRSMQGVIYIACSAQGYILLLYETYRLCSTDLRVFDREHNENCVSVAGYLISRRLSKCLTEDLYVPLIFSVSKQDFMDYLL